MVWLGSCAGTLPCQRRYKIFLFVDEREAAVVLEGFTYVESIFASLISIFALAELGMDYDTAADMT